MIYFFIKFVERIEYAEEFVQGSLYLSPLWRFRGKAADLDPDRSDRFEGASAWLQPREVTLSVAGHQVCQRDIVAPIVIQPGKYDEESLLCLYAATPGDFRTVHEGNIDAFRQHLRVPGEAQRLGEYAVIVANAQEFIRRVCEEVKQRGYGMSAGLVRYFEEDEHLTAIAKPLFTKRACYAAQREYRFVISAGQAEGSPIRLEVGSLADICTIVDAGRINDEIDVRLPSDASRTGA